MTVRNWITKLLQKTSKVEQVFYVSERDKGDYNNTHVHMLIGTNSDITYKEIKYGMGNVSVGDYQPIYDSEKVELYGNINNFAHIFTLWYFHKGFFCNVVSFHINLLGLFLASAKGHKTLRGNPMQ